MASNNRKPNINNIMKNIESSKVDKQKNFNQRNNNTHFKRTFDTPITIKQIIPKDLRDTFSIYGNNVFVYFTLPHSKNEPKYLGIKPNGRIITGHFMVNIKNANKLNDTPKGLIKFIGLGVPFNYVWKWYLINSIDKNHEDAEKEPLLLKTACEKPAYSSDNEIRSSQIRVFMKTKYEHCGLLAQKYKDIFFIQDINIEETKDDENNNDNNDENNADDDVEVGSIEDDNN
ncbi:MAG: hypothetical protein KIT69_15515 [Propionibacteriaceae bacterium]|nr:hypothetical protein [Propionibacteriaceae bacterium]